MYQFKQHWDNSATKLLGENIVIGVFVSHPQRPWAKRDKLQTEEQLKNALDWLQTQSQPYEVKFGLDYELPNLKTKDAQVQDLEDALDLSDNVDDISQQLGFQHLNDFYEQYRQKYASHNLVFLFFVNALNNESAVSYCTGREEVEYAVLVRDARYNKQISYFTIAHELLHAYSVPDLYAYDDKPASLKAAKAAQQYVKSDVMLCDETAEGYYEISEYTAFILGWHHYPQNWYVDISPPDFKETIQDMLIFHPIYDEKACLKLQDAEVQLDFRYEFGYLKCLYFHSVGYSIWIFYENKPDSKIATVLREQEKSIDEGYYWVKNQSYSLQIPHSGGMGKVQVENQWYDWYEVAWSD